MYCICHYSSRAGRWPVGCLFSCLISKCQAAAAKPLDASEGIQTDSGWLLLMDLNSQPSP